MEKEIALLIYNYVTNNKKIDNNFINETIQIIIKYFDLKDYIKEILPLDNKKTYAMYNRANKTIYINYNKLKDYIGITTLLNLKNYKFTNYYEFILFIQLLLHEAIHANQYKYAETYKKFFIHQQIEKQSNPEDIILYSEFNAFDSLIQDIEQKRINIIKGYITAYTLHKKYRKLYDYSPSERMASVDSTKIAAEIATLLDDESTAKLMTIENYEFRLAGYNTINQNQYITEPTKFYLNNINSNQQWAEITKTSSELTKEERIRLGLKVPPEYLYQLSNKSKKLILELKK